MLPHTPTQLYLVSIRFRRKISFVTSFTISNRLKKYYFKSQHKPTDTKGYFLGGKSVKL